MSNFSNQGLRKEKILANKKVKKHIKEFYNILGDMETLSTKLDKNLEYTEENINEYVNPIYGRDLDSMEKFLLLGKLHYGKENNS